MVWERTNSSANILAARETWSLGAVMGRVSEKVMILFHHVFDWCGSGLTDDEGYHGSAIASGLFEALDEFLYFPYFNILLSVIGLWGAHNERQRRVYSVQ